MTFCVCHPDYEPTDAEMNAAVEQYLIERPTMAQAWEVGFLNQWTWEGRVDFSVEKSRDLIRFWATHLTDADRRFRASRVSIRIEGVESLASPLLSDASFAEVQARLDELERCRSMSLVTSGLPKETQ